MKSPVNNLFQSFLSRHWFPVFQVECFSVVMNVFLTIWIWSTFGLLYFENKIFGIYFIVVSKPSKILCAIRPHLFWPISFRRPAICWAFSQLLLWKSMQNMFPSVILLLIYSLKLFFSFKVCIIIDYFKWVDIFMFEWWIYLVLNEYYLFFLLRYLENASWGTPNNHATCWLH